jgi:hypothetical protein
MGTNLRSPVNLLAELDGGAPRREYANLPAAPPPICVPDWMSNLLAGLRSNTRGDLECEEGTASTSERTILLLKTFL